MMAAGPEFPSFADFATRAAADIYGQPGDILRASGQTFPGLIREGYRTLPRYSLYRYSYYVTARSMQMIMARLM